MLAGKVFVVREEIDLDGLAIKLRDYRTEEPYEYENRKLELLTEVRGLTLTADSLHGVFAQDQVMNVYHRGEFVPTVRTIEAPITFHQEPHRVLLTVLEKKQRANNIANALSKLVFIESGAIVEARIPPDVMRQFHEEHFEDTKIVFFDDLDLPSIEKLSLYGSALANTSLYSDYLKHGKIWYVVIKAKKYGYVVGVTRNCVVTSFSRIDEPEFMAFITKEIFPLIA